MLNIKKSFISYSLIMVLLVTMLTCIPCDVFAADMVNIGYKKPLTYSENRGIWPDGGKLEFVNDGKTDKHVAFNPANAAAGEMTWFRFDLLKPYPINAINIYTRNNATTDTSDMTIYGSNKLCPVEEMDVIYECPGGLPINQKNEILTNGKSYRYITFQKVKNGHFVVNEVEIMTKADVDYKSDWQISQDDTSYTATIDDVEVLGGDKITYSALVTGYDIEGNLSLLDIKLVELNSGENQIMVSGTKPEGTGDVYIMLINSFTDLKTEFRPSTFNENAFGTEKAAVELDGEEVASFVILKSGRNFENGFEKDDILFMDIKMAGEDGKAKFSYDFEKSNSVGMFNARTFVTKADGTVETQDYTYFYFTQKSIDDMVSEFRNFKDNSEFVEKLEYYTVLNPYFYLDDVPELKDEQLKESIGEYFIDVRDLYLKDNGNTVDDLVNAFKMAYIWYSACTESDISVLAKYGELMEAFDEKIHSSEKVLTMMSRLKDTVSDSESFLKACNTACLYSTILETDIEDTVEMLKKYSVEFGIDLSYPEEKNVTVTEIVKQIDTSHPELYIDKLNDKFKEIADDISEERQNKKPTTVSKGQSGRGGGGSVSIRVEKPETVEPETETPQPIEPEIPEVPENVKQENKYVFNDINHLPWAKESIVVLSEKNIVSGVDGISFMPDRNLTREEFAKIVFLAFEIDKENGKIASFTDCNKEQWFYPYVNALYRSNIINGISGSEFGVGKEISRQDVAVILDRIISLHKKIKIEKDAFYTDLNQVSEYARDAVNRLSQEGIVNGNDDGTFNPNGMITRAEAAVMVHRVMEYIGV